MQRGRALHEGDFGISLSRRKQSFNEAGLCTNEINCQREQSKKRQFDEKSWHTNFDLFKIQLTTFCFVQTATQKVEELEKDGRALAAGVVGLVGWLDDGGIILKPASSLSPPSVPSPSSALHLYNVPPVDHSSGGHLCLVSIWLRVMCTMYYCTTVC